MSPGHHLDVEVEIKALYHNGDGVADMPEGRTPLHLPGVFPAERVVARVKHVGAQRSHGAVLEVVSPHTGRRTAPCAMHASRSTGRCTGCAFMLLEPGAQRDVKRAWLCDTFGLDVEEVVGGEATAYRWSSKRVAFGGPGNVRLGSFVRGTHNVALMEDCVVEHPAIVRAASVVEGAAQRAGVTAYDAKRGGGDLRHVWLKTDGKHVLITLIMAHDRTEAADSIARAIREIADADTIAGVATSINDGAGNTIRGSAPKMLFGRDTLTVNIAGLRTTVGPLGFLQPNPSMAGRCYQALVGGVSGELALDLYAGAGVTTALLRASYKTVVPVEAYAESAAALGVEAVDVAAFLEGYEGDTPDLVIANPPRKGLGPRVTRALRELGPSLLRIMSCGPKGLKRDLAALTQAPGDGQQGYTLESLRAYDTLPQTPHVELVAYLRRTDPKTETKMRNGA